MGMDLEGLKPTSPEGADFRLNVWHWRPVADLVLDLFPKETAACEYWHSNDGDGLDAEQSGKLADAIEQALESGEIADYAAAREARLKALPLEPCSFCGGAGTRHLDGGTIASCNVCDGEGKRKSTETWYVLNLESVKAFAKFLRASGGFAIY